GGTPNRKKKEFYLDGSIPWVKTGDLKNKFISEPNEFITEAALNNSSAKLFPENTVLIAMYGATIGACSILKIDAATNQACCALLPSKQVNEVYLYYYLKSIKSELIGKGVGGAQPNISGSIIKKTEIPLPPLPIQERIAEILDAADTLRQKDRQLLVKYEQLSQSIFLDMFGDPVSNPKGWEIKEMKNLTTQIGSGNTPKGGSQVYVDKGITFFRSQNVWRNKLEM
ncbi:type I restriction endonuclease subunit R, partial [Marivirga lumbricoides]